MSKSREQLNAWLKTIRINGGCLLDVGVQDKPVRDRLGLCEVDCYKTLDNDPQWKPDYVHDLNSPGLIDNRKFDYIFAIEVFEHLWNPLQALYSLRVMMLAESRLYLSWPFINPIHDYFDANRYTLECMRMMLKVNDLEIVDVQYRRATSGYKFLMNFFEAEGQRVSKIRPAFDHDNRDIIGFMLIAKPISKSNPTLL